MVSKEVLRQVVYRQKERLKNLPETVEREITGEILKYVPDKRILILSGLRRSGKSTILNQIMERIDNYCYVNFEDERFIDFEAGDFESLNEILAEVYGPADTYFFDEIQNVDKFESFVRRLHDDGRKIILTGSNASLLSRELGTKLTGRYKLFEVYPFSFREYLTLKDIHPTEEWRYVTEKKAVLSRELRSYMEDGGLPEYLKNKDPDYVRTLYENIIYRDIIARYSIKRHKTLKELVNILSTNTGTPQSLNRLKNTLELTNTQTVKEYITYLENAYFCFEHLKHEYSTQKQARAPKKIYLVDPAFTALTSMNFSENQGRKLENLVYIHLKRLNKETYYHREKRECDFLIKEKNRITQAIQVSLALNGTSREREIAGLVEAMEKYELGEGLILTMDERDELESNGKRIVILPVWEYLLEEARKQPVNT